MVSIPTSDKSTTLRVQVEYPPQKRSGKYPVVVVAGGMFSDRDGITDAGEIGGDVLPFLLFRQLSKQLLTMGFVVVRYDQRGISGNVYSCREGMTLAFSDYIMQCVDNKVRAKVNPKNIREDIESVFSYAAQLRGVDPNNIYVLGHSEASLHMSALIEEKRIAPVGLIFIAGIAESPARHLQWQAIDRFVDALPQADKNKDGIITNEEIHSLFMDERSVVNQQCQNCEKAFLSPTGSWRANDLAHVRSRAEPIIYKDFFAYVNVSNTDDHIVVYTISSTKVTYASLSWLSDRFNDKKPVIEKLDAYRGKGLFIFLSLDSQISVSRQIAAIEKSKFGLSHKAKIVTIDGFGHLLGKTPGKGPVDPQAMNEVSAAIRAWLPVSIQSR